MPSWQVHRLALIAILTAITAIKAQVLARLIVPCITLEAGPHLIRTHLLDQLQEIAQDVAVAGDSLPASITLFSKHRRPCLSHRAAMVLDTASPAKCWATQMFKFWRVAPQRQLQVKNATTPCGYLRTAAKAIQEETMIDLEVTVRDDQIGLVGHHSGAAGNGIVTAKITVRAENVALWVALRIIAVAERNASLVGSSAIQWGHRCKLEGGSRWVDGTVGIEVMVRILEEVGVPREESAVERALEREEFS